MYRSIFFSLMICTAFGAQAFELQAGLWRFQVTQNIGGMPLGDGALRFEQCLSKNDPIPTAYLQAQRCDVLERDEKPGKLHWRISCFTDHGTVTNEGFLKLNGRRLRGRSQSDLGEVQGRHTVMRYQLSGTRIGQCQNP